MKNFIDYLVEFLRALGIEINIPIIGLILVVITIDLGAWVFLKLADIFLKKEEAARFHKYYSIFAVITFLLVIYCIYKLR